MKRVLAAIAIIIRGSEVLICQRKQSSTFGGYWEFPGGKCEAGETPEACVVREVREEVALAVRIVEGLEPILHDYPHASLRLYPFWCEHVEGEPQAIDCARAMWVSPGELRGYRFPPANEELIETIIERMSRRPGV